MPTRRIQLSFLILSGLFALASCKTQQGAADKSYVGKSFTTTSGLTYTIHRAGDGKRAQPGDIVKVHYAGTLDNGSEFDNSFKRGEPIRFTLGKGQVIKGWDEGIAILNVGDSATFHIPGSLAYGEQGRPGIPANATLHFDVVLVEIVEPMKPFDINGVDSTVLSGGVLKYTVKQNPDGKQAKAGQEVVVHYTGYLKNGKKFDSSVDRGTPFSFLLGQGRVIKGWDVALATMKTGEKARLILPSDMGYGERGNNVIPPNATLIFDVELIDIK